MFRKQEKRKVVDTSFESSDHEQEKKAFLRSKLVPRSPEKEENKEMEQVLKELKGMRTDMVKGFKDCNDQNEALKTELAKVNRELQQIKEEMKTKELEWQKEKKELKTRVVKLEEKIEEMEKHKKKNNIIIKNIKIPDEKVREQTTEFFKQQLGVNAEVEDAFKINRDVILVKMTGWEEKMKIMRSKNNLRGTDIYIDNDMTKKEREIQRKLRQIAKEEIEKGNKATVKYKKLVVNNKTYNWKEIEQDTQAKN